MLPHLTKIRNVSYFTYRIFPIIYLYYFIGVPKYFGRLLIIEQLKKTWKDFMTKGCT